MLASVTPLTEDAPERIGASTHTTNAMLVVHGARTEPVPGTPVPVVATVAVIANAGGWVDELVEFLGSEGFAVVLDPDGGSAFDHRCRTADAAVIDLQLATRSATTVCAAWRRRSLAPVLAVTGTRDEATVLAAFTAGADHVVVKDVTCRQIVAHLRSLLRRVPPRRGGPDSPPTDPSFELGADRRSAVVLGRTVRLTDEEFELLALLLERRGGVVTRAELASALVYSSDSSRAVDFFVRRLREKLEHADGRRRIVVVRGVGFRYATAAEMSLDAPDGGTYSSRGDAP